MPCLEYPVDDDAVKLTDGVLIKGAHAHVAASLTRHVVPPPVLSG